MDHNILKNYKHYLAAILAFSIWGFFSLVLKPLHAYAPLDILFYRVFSCAIVMSMISLLFKRKSFLDNLRLLKSLPKKKRSIIIGLNVGGSIFLTVNWFSFIYVMNHVSVRATSVAYLVCPILTTLLAFFLLSERLTRLQWFSVVLSCSGCLLLSYTNISDMFFSIIIGLSYALYMISQNKNSGLDKFLVLNFHILLSAVLLAFFYPAFSGPIPSDFKFYFYVEIIAVIYTIVPLFLNLYALSRISSSKVAMILNINPIIAFILAGVVYHEPLGLLQIVAYALVFTAVIIFSISKTSSANT
ncbi:chloramphenicol-sensitive protein RarD [Pedobacter sp. W3I1]|uniref:EamA family transporter n=1 Tax=Pedobacter sp. W3I1 TaxID=3042291 RepID=UPI002782FC98|nr:chloramphenicol-sensitive protein RarD [Pedobacter sp. W3I1]